MFWSVMPWCGRCARPVIPSPPRTISRSCGPRANQFDLVLLDLDLGGAGLVQEQHIIRLREHGAAVLIVSAAGSPRHVQRMLRAGALGVVAKSDSMDDLGAAVGAALSGRPWMSPMLAQAITLDQVDRPVLSDQELLALQLYACGLETRQRSSTDGGGQQYCQAVHRSGSRQVRESGSDGPNEDRALHHRGRGRLHLARRHRRAGGLNMTPGSPQSLTPIRGTNAGRRCLRGIRNRLRV